MTFNHSKTMVDAVRAVLIWTLLASPCVQLANGFVTPSSSSLSATSLPRANSFQASPSTSPATELQALSSLLSSSLESASTAVATSVDTAGMSIDKSKLAQYFLETLISYGVPAFFWIIVIAFAAKSIKSARDDSRSDGMASGASAGPNGNLFGRSSNVINSLYDDLYGSTDDPGRSGKSPFSFLSPSSRGPNNTIPKNIGIPKKQYIEITKLNDVYSSYQYSITAATQSKAKAASQYRSYAFSNALQRAFDSSAADTATTTTGDNMAELSNAQKSDLLLEEKEFLKRGVEVMNNIIALQCALTDLIIQDEMKQMDVDIGEVDAHPTTSESTTNDGERKKVIDATIVEKKQDSESIVNNNMKSKKKKKQKGGDMKKEMNRLMKDMERENTELLTLEMEFIRAIIEVMGPDRANAIRAALLGNIAGGGAGTAGGLLKSLQERPLKQIFANIGYISKDDTDNDIVSSKSLFVTDFPGDVSASQVDTLREEVTAIIQASKPGDEALLLLQTGGGTVTGYGLAAAQLQRFKKHGLKLTICVEQVAASGGYMMTCVADKVIASPFAVLGSIGVISDLPNVYERLKKEGIEFQTITAGKFKRTLTPTKKVEQKDIDKQKDELEGILTLFKGFVKENRPSLDIDAVATGETWFGEDALEKGLCDELRTVDDVLVDYVGEGYNVYQVRYKPEGLNASPLGSLLPIGQSDSNQGGLVRGSVRWLVRNIVPAIKDEIAKELNGGFSSVDSSSTSKVRERYMFKDPTNTSTTIKAQDY